MTIQISSSTRVLKGTVDLPTSKSVSNRALIIHALANSMSPLHNLSDSDDTDVMLKILNSNNNRFDVGHAGTSMRFLTAFLSNIMGEWHITGSARMQQRPIGVLVDALRKLGAQIDYTGEEGFPPLKITGTKLKGGQLSLDGSISSQYVSAILMIAPTMQGGLELTLEGDVTSSSYIRMTLGLMKRFGIDSSWNGQVIAIAEQSYNPIDYTIEADWSGASYWYEMVAISNEADVMIKGLQLESLQGDSMQAQWFEEAFGVVSEQTDDGVRLIKKPVELPKNLSLDFINCPDIAQTFAVVCVCLGVPFQFSGLKTLKIKETDRIHALITELGKMGATLYEPENGQLAWDGTMNKTDGAVIETYHDHRMALAFAPAAMHFEGLKIVDHMVVTKSYPKYWDHLQDFGFQIEQ